MSNAILKNDKMKIIFIHNKLMQNNKNALIFYTNKIKSKNNKNVKTADFVVLIFNFKLYQRTKNQNMHKKMEFDEFNKEIGINWKLNLEITELNAELHAIYKATVREPTTLNA